MLTPELPAGQNDIKIGSLRDYQKFKVTKSEPFGLTKLLLWAPSGE